MDEFINVLLNAILNGGVIGSCEALCGHINKTVEKGTCMVLCGYVGIKEFIKIINETDPDPIFMCQELGACIHRDGGKVEINSTSVAPTSGPAGTHFKIGMAYTVINATSTGLLVINIIDPSGMGFGGDDLVEGQAPDFYQVAWDLDTTPNQDEPFLPGNYTVQLAICAGDCSTVHKWGGVYAQTTTQFVITPK